LSAGLGHRSVAHGGKVGVGLGNGFGVRLVLGVLGRSGSIGAGG
jgi:hypothetical protein